jgi:quercetin dioxygenase-like cupin family protein
MKTMIRALGLAIGLAAIAPASADTEYKDTCSVAPNNCKILKEDATFRVIDYHAKKGDKVGMHSHPAHVIYVLEGGKTKFMLPDGSSKELDTKTGEAIINPPTVHATDHLTDLHVIIVELKK